MSLFKDLKKAFNRYLVPRLLKSGLVYEVGERLSRLQTARHSLAATALMTRFALEMTRKAYDSRYPTVWTNVFAPTELLYAMDLVPFSPEVAAATAASLGLNDRLLSAAEGRWYATDTCSFHRCALGGALLDYLPEPAAMVCTGHICDGSTKLFIHAARHYGKPLFILDTPYGSGPAAVTYLRRQMEDLTGFLARHTGAVPDPDRLRESILLSNEVRGLMSEVNALRRASPCPMRGRDALGYVYLVFLGQGSPQAVEVYRTLRDELADRAERGEGAVASERFRLLWLHLKPYYPNDLLDYLEDELGAVVVCEEMNHVYWPPVDPADPYTGLAQKALAHFGYGPLARRVEVVRHLARDYRLHGVIHFSHWGCRQTCGGVRVLKDALQADGVRFLALDGDCVDNRNYAEGQVRTRLAGFVESLGA